MCAVIHFHEVGGSKSAQGLLLATSAYYLQYMLLFRSLQECKKCTFEEVGDLETYAISTSKFHN